METTPNPRELIVREDGIRLGQALKLADLAESGVAAKELLAAGAVTVNGEVETRRGRQLAVGDVVATTGDAVRLVAGGGAGPRAD